MTGRLDPDDTEPKDRKSAQLLLLGVLALGVVATGVLVLTSDPAWLRLGVLAALWAALAGAYLAAKFRKQVGEREDDVADLQHDQEVERAKEAAARREFELEIEAETRRRVQEEGRTDLAELRAELRALRENLDRLTGGEVLVERFALRAQSTRMRSLSPDEQRRSLAAGPRPVLDQAATELLSRMDAGPPSQPGRARPVVVVPDAPPASAESSGYGTPVDPRRPDAEPQPARPAARREPTARTPRTGTPTGRTPVNTRTPTGRTPVRPGRPANPMVDSVRTPAAPNATFDSARTPRPAPQPDPNPMFDSARNPAVDSGYNQPVGPARNPAVDSGYNQPVGPGRNPVVDSGYNQPVGPGRNPMVDSGRTPHAAPPRNPIVDSGPNPVVDSGRNQRVGPPPNPAARSAAAETGAIPGAPARAAGGPPQASRAAGRPPSRAAATARTPVPGASRPAPPRAAEPPADPPQAHRAAQADVPTRVSHPVAPPPGAPAFGAPSEHTPAAWQDTPAERPAEISGGGRRRAEDRPAWQSSGYTDPVDPPAHAGPPPSGRRAAPDPEPSGAHTAGKSVTELLAAHATDDNARRHRRRAD
jgi:hypothetical protein